jgi:hypothetical protein
MPAAASRLSSATSSLPSVSPSASNTQMLADEALAFRKRCPTTAMVDASGDQAGSSKARSPRPPLRRRTGPPSAATTYRSERHDRSASACRSEVKAMRVPSGLHAG